MSRKESQLDLFAGASGPAAPRPTGVAPAPVRPEHAALAPRLPAGVRLGTSTWSFPGWAGLVYASQETTTTLAREGLPAYGKHPLLRTAGVDRTHYGALTAAEFADYAAQVPDAFRFVVKSHERLTL